jgi:HEPN domain-containing protein
VLVARLNHDKLRILSESRLEEARVLLERKLWTGAYYLTGLAVECALKAFLAQAVQQHDLPDKSFINRVYTHKLKDIVQIDTTLWQELEKEIRSDIKLRTNWTIVLQWNDENRYEVVDESEAISLYAATAEPVTGVMDWIKRRWR